MDLKYLKPKLTELQGEKCIHDRSLNELLYLKGLNMLYEDSMSFTVCQNSTKSAWEIWPHQGNLTH